MAKKKENNPEAIFPNGVHWGVIQLERDLTPHPAAQRLIQWVNKNGVLKVYVSESAYHRTEIKMWFDKFFRDSYSSSISKGGVALGPVKGRIHWLEFNEEFVLTGKGLRMNPETDEPEEEKK